MGVLTDHMRRLGLTEDELREQNVRRLRAQ
jgi:hypothetical protein